MNPSIIAQAARQTAARWAAKFNESSGAEQEIYGEVSDAFREFAELVERLEKEAEEAREALRKRVTPTKEELLKMYEKDFNGPLPPKRPWYPPPPMELPKYPDIPKPPNPMC